MKLFSINVKTIKDLKKYIHDDNFLNIAIQQTFSEDISNWRIENYSVLREMAYPLQEDYLDAIVKNDEVALQEYIQKCLIVKERFPKC